MTKLTRVLFVTLLAVWLAMPGIGSDTGGGENAGGTGVWILPACAVMTSDVITSDVARSSTQIQGVTSSVKLKLSSEMASSAAVLYLPALGDPVSLDVCGSRVVIKKSVLALLAASHASAKVVIMDAHGRGYMLQVLVTEPAPGRFTISMKVY